MRVIYKYKLKLEDEQKIEMPFGSKLLCVQMQDDVPCLWADVDPDCSATEHRKILIIGTGHKNEALPCATYISTFQMSNGALVFHVFEDER